jgi:trans-aconitate methyltransferase
MGDLNEQDIAGFYDEFSRNLLRSYLYGNERLDRAIARVCAQITPGVRRILDIGCGIGVSTDQLAKACPGADVLGVDISPENIRIAEALFRSERISFKVSTLADGAVQGPFDIISMIDVYEHIPASARRAVQASLRTLLADHGRLVVAVPSPLHQQHLKDHQPEGLQIVDEVITAEDALELAHAVGGTLMTFEHVGVWRTNDYVHIVIQRNPAYAPRKLPHGARALGQRLRRAYERLRRRASIQRALGVHLPLRNPGKGAKEPGQ